MNSKTKDNMQKTTFVPTSLTQDLTEVFVLMLPDKDKAHIHLLQVVRFDLQPWLEYQVDE